MKTKAASLLDRAKQSNLARNTFWMFLGQGARVPIQAVYFILIARSLGAKGYGAFVGVAALAAILSPFVSMGCGNLLIKHVSRDGSCFRKYWGKTLLITLASGMLLCVAALLLSRTLLPDTVPLALVLSVAVSDLIFVRILDVTAQAYQAHQRLARTSLLMVSLNLSRLLLLAILLLFGGNLSPVLWGFFYLAGAAAASAAGVFLANRELGIPAFDRAVLFTDMREGFYFSVSLSSANIYNDIDKTMLTRLSTLEAAGIYAAAYRIIDVSFMPVRSLVYAAYARFFQSGQNGIGGTVGFAAKLMPYACGYGLVASLLLFLSAPVLPYILGNGYSETVSALRWLSLLPLLKSIHYFASDSLTGAGFQGLRSICQLATAALNVGLILWLIPAYSWKGAAWASLASDSFLALVTWALVLWLKKRETAVSAGRAAVQA